EMGVKQLFDLGGRTALVTGGSRGLGLQIAETLVELGARVALVARKADDLADTAAIAPMIEQAVTALGPLDILVNNAGATWGAATVDMPLEAWQKVVNLNLTATF